MRHGGILATYSLVGSATSYLVVRFKEWICRGRIEAVNWPNLDHLERVTGRWGEGLIRVPQLSRWTDLEGGTIVMMMRPDTEHVLSREGV
ncbi:hypothetical protein LZ31DRAFT_556892 [Colletotrichum somersetense]|nr:hypothetical protein LZ31DRAFT_556892 [Colletotrichum somersetense]